MVSSEPKHRFCDAPRHADHLGLGSHRRQWGSLHLWPEARRIYRRVAYFVDRILKGAKPSELPIEQPTVLEFVVNLSAEALGITIPPAVLARANRVIE
jgi:ABC transporter substrate binding protein